MHKDSLTGQEIIDYDFWGTKLFPPKKLNVTDTGREIEAMFRELDRLHYPSKKKDSEMYFRTGRGNSPQKQPCVVKMYYTESKEQHLKFLRNYMPQMNKKEVKDKPELFNENYDSVPESVILDYERIASDKGFKFIISPESQNIDMKCLVRQLVCELEHITGFKLSWLAATHTDTEHVHTHLLVNGIDKKSGEEIYFDPSIVRNLARRYASEICTQLNGYRSEQQIEASRQNLPYARRWTKIDEHITEYYGYEEFSNDRIVGNSEYEASKVTADELEIQRLNFLVSIGLALVYKKSKPLKYYLEKGWKEKLKAVGRYNTYLDARKKLTYMPGYKLEIYDGSMGKINGVITQIYNMDDENIWNNAVVIENRAEDRAWYVPLRTKLKNDDVGKFITVKAEMNKKGKLRPLIFIDK